MVPSAPSPTEPQPRKEMEWGEFLITQPPYSECKVIGLTSGDPHYVLRTPRILLFCDSAKCGGDRIFVPTHNIHTYRGEVGTPFFLLLLYHCKHCEETQKAFALAIRMRENTEDGTAMKLGELPAFGPITPPRLLRLVQSDRELYLKGRRSESQGLGIGAFAYYRRVVENQKNQLIDGIIKVSKRLRVAEPIIANLESAKQQIQFSSAIEMIRDGIPDSLKIDGQNPLSLLHSALSKGIHSESEEECLQLAASIRLVLTSLAENIDQALQDHAELSEAVKRLSQSGLRQKEKTDQSKPKPAGSGVSEPS